eukprot:1452765-Amphidinium_carterae.1
MTRSSLKLLVGRVASCAAGGSQHYLDSQRAHGQHTEGSSKVQTVGATSLASSTPRHDARSSYL